MVMLYGMTMMSMMCMGRASGSSRSFLLCCRSQFGFDFDIDGGSRLGRNGMTTDVVVIAIIESGIQKIHDLFGRERILLDATITFDERIADGFYFAKSLRIARFLLENPEYLNETMETSVPVDLS